MDDRTRMMAYKPDILNKMMLEITIMIVKEIEKNNARKPTCQQCPVVVGLQRNGLAYGRP